MGFFFAVAVVCYPNEGYIERQGEREATVSEQREGGEWRGWVFRASPEWISLKARKGDLPLWQKMKRS